MRIDNLPQYLTPFVGRTDEIAALTSLLDDPTCRLITLVGPGGIGKTRLAVEVARQVEFSDGIYFVSFQALGVSEDIVTTIIEALPLQRSDNLEDQPLLLNYLQEKQMLLVLDNFEHLMDGVDIVTNILDVAAQVKLLVTSRERLNLRAEQVWLLQGLDIPDDTMDALALPSAVSLFDERARRAHPAFSWQDNFAAVATICKAVEGTPLAIELAASWVYAIPCEVIAEEIQRNIDMLVSRQRDLPERHRSMRAVFNHSWNLLTANERVVFSRLSVFRGGLTTEAAKQVSGSSIETLASLIDKSLVRLDAQSRYDQHELVRQYAAEQLEIAGASHATHDAHSAYYAAFLNHRVQDLKGRRQLEALAEINADFENLRLAWHWAAEHKQADAIEQMIEGLWLYCKLCSRLQDRLALFQYAEEKLVHQQGDVPQQLWARLLARAADGKAAQKQLETALEIAQSVNDRAEIAFCFEQLSAVAHGKGQYDEAKQLLEQSLTIYRQLDDRYAAASVLSTIMLFAYTGAYEYAIYYGENYGQEALKLSAEIGDEVGRARSLIVAALQALRKGEFDQAKLFWQEQATMGQESNNLLITGLANAHISHKIQFVQGDFAQAQAMGQEALRLGKMLDDASLLGWALASLGLLACMDEHYREAKQLCEQSASKGGYALIPDLAAWGLAIAACGLGDYHAARQHVVAASGFLSIIMGPVGMIGSLPIVSIICAHQGRYKEAVELLALAFTHPLQASGWMKKWSLLDRLQADLKAELGEKLFADAWARGGTFDLESTYRHWLHELKSEQNTPDLSVNQQLSDPLSPRELEVLSLIVDGLTNREIAERLYIGTNTVKKHVNHIYSKLDVKDRTEAVNCAKKSCLIS